MQMLSYPSRRFCADWRYDSLIYRYVGNCLNQTSHDIVFLFGADNTLPDNDRVQADPMRICRLSMAQQCASDTGRFSIGGK
jgi:hypothetical protein